MCTLSKLRFSFVGSALFFSLASAHSILLPNVTVGVGQNSGTTVGFNNFQFAQNVSLSNSLNPQGAAGIPFRNALGYTTGFYTINISLNFGSSNPASFQPGTWSLGFQDNSTTTPLLQGTVSAFSLNPNIANNSGWILSLQSDGTLYHPPA